MVKKAPAATLVGNTVFETKGEAQAFAIKQRAKKKSSGYNTRFEIDMDPQTGKFRVREFVYMTDEKGRLV